MTGPSFHLDRDADRPPRDPAAPEVPRWLQAGTALLLGGLALVVSFDRPVPATPSPSAPAPTVTPAAPTPALHLTASHRTRLERAADKASSATILAQTARSPGDWQLVAQQWQQAIAGLKAVPKSDPEWTTAQKQLATYQQQLATAQASATAAQRSPTQESPAAPRSLVPAEPSTPVYAVPSDPLQRPYRSRQRRSQRITYSQDCVPCCNQEPISRYSD